ncbi:hypothetical protein, partial [Pseudomonas sp. S11A4]|uniref:hypothetical protein n=1 Tax=Pseudomonas sp. S11A4 TaxID=1476791 RepID=UPI00406CB62B
MPSLALMIDGERSDAALCAPLPLLLDGLLDVLRIEVKTTHDQLPFKRRCHEQFTVAQKPQILHAARYGRRAGRRLWRWPGVAPVAEMLGPVAHTADGVIRQLFQRIRFDDQHRVLRWLMLPLMNRAAITRPGAVLRQGLIVDTQRWNAGARGVPATNSVASAVFAEAMKLPALKPHSETFRRSVRGRRGGSVRTGIPPRQRLKSRRAKADSLTCLLTSDSQNPVRHRCSPYSLIAWSQRNGRPRKYAGDMRMHGTPLKIGCSKPPIRPMRWYSGEPVDDRAVRIDVDAETVADQLFVGDQIAVADLHA